MKARRNLQTIRYPGSTSVPPASYLTKAALAAELMISESSVDEFVRRGLLPTPVRISSGCVRWRWETVDEVLRASQGQCIQSEQEAAGAEGAQRILEHMRSRRRALRQP